MSNIKVFILDTHVDYVNQNLKSYFEKGYKIQGNMTPYKGTDNRNYVLIPLIKNIKPI
jgi:hypothetical protein